jgi:hypothetical protein
MLVKFPQPPLVPDRYADSRLWRCSKCKIYLLSKSFQANSDVLTRAKRPVAYTCRACLRISARERYRKRHGWRPVS